VNRQKQLKFGVFIILSVLLLIYLYGSGAEPNRSTALPTVSLHQRCSTAKSWGNGVALNTEHKRLSTLFYEFQIPHVSCSTVAQELYNYDKRRGEHAFELVFIEWGCPANHAERRVGLNYPDDGGKQACVPKVKQPDCLIYSFGSNNQWDFEISARENFGCEIHTFDCTIKGRVKGKPDFVHFHPFCVGGSNVTGEDLYTYNQIVEKLGHTDRQVLVLKVDIEGWEWHFFPDYLTSPYPRAKQILFELHVGVLPDGYRPHGTVGEEVLHLMQHFDANGYTVFSRDPNYMYGPVQIACEYSLYLSHPPSAHASAFNYRLQQLPSP